MADKSWKQFERRIAQYFGGARRGAGTRDGHGGKDDVIHSHFSIECKLVKKIHKSMIDAAIEQAERNALPHQEPIAILKENGRGKRDLDALVVMRLETFLDWRVGDV